MCPSLTPQLTGFLQATLSTKIRATTTNWTVQRLDQLHSYLPSTEACVCVWGGVAQSKGSSKDAVDYVVLLSKEELPCLCGHRVLLKNKRTTLPLLATPSCRQIRRDLKGGRADTLNWHVEVRDDRSRPSTLLWGPCCLGINGWMVAVVHILVAGVSLTCRLCVLSLSLRPRRRICPMGNQEMTTMRKRRRLRSWRMS